MLAQGDESDRRLALMTLIEGYDTFESFDLKELRLIEPLRTLRLIHYSDWLAARTEDPAFPRAFPDFGTPAYWTARTVELWHQVESMAEPLERLLP
jgi:Ser/Thr protein kinase RdoA (MazF antagonist)